MTQSMINKSIPATVLSLYGGPFVSKFFLKYYGSGTNQMGGFVGGAPFLQMADSWTWRILGGSLAPPLRRAGEGERAEESGDTAIQSVAERNAIIGS